MQKAEDVNAVLEGVELIYKKFIDILGKQGVSIIDTKEADFDVDLHEAVAQLPAPTPELKGKVMDCSGVGRQLSCGNGQRGRSRWFPRLVDKYCWPQRTDPACHI